MLMMTATGAFAEMVLNRGNSADPGGGPLDYEWFQVSGVQVSISGVFTAEPSFAAPQVTGADFQLEFELTVTNERSSGIQALSNTGE